MGNFFVDGVRHITDIDGYDHMLFLLALTAPYSYRDWKAVVLLATAFTVGHSVSLFLAAADVVRFSSELIEALIPATIVLTCIGNLVTSKAASSRLSMTYRYAFALAFGLIHGMGFSSFFRMIFNEGESFVAQLFLFNLGVESGQIIIIAMLLVLIALFEYMLPNYKRHISVLLSSSALVIASYLLAERIL
ncbi:MAG: HupE/UreJ family protein [Flavobacteriales bacterium]|jgi:hypothetical protein